MNTNEITQQQYTDNLFLDAKTIIEKAKTTAYQSVNATLVQRNWFLGQRIAIEELKYKDRAEYGLEIIKNLSKELTAEYGKGFDRSNLYHFLNFYYEFPQIVDTACRQFNGLLSWSHYRVLLQEKNIDARQWYEKESYTQTWSVKTLQLYDELKKSKDDNPSLGIVLCAETDEDVARYSVMHGNEQLFASKYKLYLPSEDELRKEIEEQKILFQLQQEDSHK